MGNCLPYFSFLNRRADDLTRLNNLHEIDNHNTYGNSSRFSSSSIRRSFRPSNEEENRSRHRSRNSQPSSYVNELYVNYALDGGIGEEESMNGNVLTEKRIIRIRGLLEQIPIEVYDKNGKGDDECAICMVDFVVNDKIRYLPCMHSYHVSCIDDWLIRSFTCPSCMEPVDSAILSAFTAGNSNLSLSSLACTPAKILN